MAEFPENDFTRMIEMTSRENRVSGGRPRMGVASAIPMPTVQSADLGKPVEDVAPLTAEEREKLDEEARRLGILDPRLGNQNPDGSLIPQVAVGGAYGSLEEALAVANEGLPVMADPTEGRQTAREFIGAREPVGTRGMMAARNIVAPVAPRIPDFRKIEGIDLIHNTVVVDGLVFPITEAEAAAFKQFVVETAREAIMSKLDEALLGFMPAPEVTSAGESAADEAVQQVPRGEV